MTSIFYDGKRAKAHEVSVALDGGNLIMRAEPGEILAYWPIAGLSRLISREQAGEYCLTRGGAARLILRDPSVQRQLAAHLDTIAHPQSRWRKDSKIIGLCLAVAVMTGLFLWQGIPLLARPIAAMISKDMEYEIGSAAYEAFLDQEGREKTCQTQAGDAALDRLVDRVLGEEDIGLPQNESLVITILDSSKENAIVLPGGFMIIFRGLLDEARHPDMLAGVIAHEVGHVAERHGLQRLVAGSVLWFFYLFLTSDFFSIPAFIAVFLVDNAYTRSMERQADFFARDLMQRKKIDPRPLSLWFERLSKKGEMFEYLTTHPASQERARFFAQEAGAQHQASLGAEDWVALKNICSAVQDEPS